MVVIVVIAVVFVLSVDLQAVRQVLSTANHLYLLAASMLLVLGLIAYAGRWRCLLNNKPALRHTFHAGNIGHAGNILLPGRAGEPIRIIVMGRSTNVSIVEATSSFVVERLFEQIMRLAALGGAVVYGIGLEVSTATVAGGIGFLVLTFSGLAWLLNHQEVVLDRVPAQLARIPRITEARVHRWLSDFLVTLSNVAEPYQFAVVLAWSLLTWSFFLGFFYLALLALADSFSSDRQLAISLGALALSPPSSATQPGLFHASVVLPLAAVGFGVEALTAYAVILHILEMLWMVGLALWGLFQTGISPRELWKRPEAV